MTDLEVAEKIIRELTEPIHTQELERKIVRAGAADDMACAKRKIQRFCPVYACYKGPHLLDKEVRLLTGRVNGTRERVYYVPVKSA